MKGMNISIDILYLDEKLRIIDIYEKVPPCTSYPCKIYSPKQGILYVLELQSGFVESHDVEEGDRIWMRKERKD